MEYTLIHGDCKEQLKKIPSNSVHSIVTDPPYGISFMGKKWDYDIPTVEVWEECLRILKPGGYLLSFASTRTHHRMAVNIEDAGFEIRDMIAWTYATGFPKSLNIGKVFDKRFNRDREVIQKRISAYGDSNTSETNDGRNLWGKPSTNIVHVDRGDSIYEGWGTALKPALEPITVARKPLSEKTILDNVLKHKTGGINIDKCRVPISTFNKIGNDDLSDMGRFPANLIHDGSDIVKQNFLDSTNNISRKVSINTSPLRFFYCAKPSKKDKNEGIELDKFIKTVGHNRFDKCKTCNGYILQNKNRPSACTCEVPVRLHNSIQGNYHPTIKPTDLMRYLVRLVTPEGGTVVDPYMGSGSTGKACMLENFNFIGIELEEEYIKIAKARIDYSKTHNTTPKYTFF